MHVRWDSALLFAIFVCVVSVNGMWIHENTVPLTWDQAGYMSVAGDIGHFILQGKIISAIHTFIHHNAWDQRPALSMLVGGLVLPFTGAIPHEIVWVSNIFWLGLLALSTFRISLRITNRFVGVLSVLLILTMPAIDAASRDFGVDLPLTASVAFVMWQLLSTDSFRNRIQSILFGIFFAFGMYAKETFILYAVLPILTYFVNIVLDKTELRRTRLFNFCISALIALVLVLPVYIPIVQPMLANVLSNVGTSTGQFYARAGSPASLAFYMVYLKYILTIGASFLYVLIPVVASFISYIIETKTHGVQKLEMKIRIETVSLLLWFSFPLAILTLFVTDTNYRFIMPILPVVAIGLAILMDKVRSKIVRYSAMGVLALVCIIQFIAQSFGLGWMPNAVSVNGFDVWNQFVQHDESITIGKPVRQEWPILPILQLISNNSAGYPTPIWIGLLTNTPYLNENVIKEYASLYDYPFRDFGIGTVVQSANYKTDINDVYFVITKAGYQGPSFATVYFRSAEQYLQQLVKSGVYSEVGKVRLPDGSYAYIYKRKL